MERQFNFSSYTKVQELTGRNYNYQNCTVPFYTKNPSAVDSESIQPLSVLRSGLKREWWPI